MRVGTTVLRDAVICGVAVLAMQGLAPASARAEPHPGAPLREEAARQEAIYRTRGENVPQGYVIDRSLLSYASILSPAFDRALARLGPSDRWLDIGAGQGLAVLDYYTERYDAMHPEGRERRGRKAQAVAMSIEDRRTDRWHRMAAALAPDQIRYVHGRRLREYSVEELGRFQLITDLVGGFSYTSRLSAFMEKVLALLERNGEFYTLLLDVRLENERQPVAPNLQLLTELENADGSEGTVCAWLKRMSCVAVTCEPDTKLGRPIELYRIRKTCDRVSVPVLHTVSFQAGTPPQRRFSARPPGPKSP